MEGNYRFYPSGEALRGFSVAGTGGFSHVGDDSACEGIFDDCTDSRARTTRRAVRHAGPPVVHRGVARGQNLMPKTIGM